MKKVLGLLLVLSLVFTMCAFTASAENDLKIGVILVGDDTEGYTLAHMEGIKAAAAKLGIADDQISWKYKVPEDSSCYEAAMDLYGQGCNMIISNSYGHQDFMAQAAEELEDATFVAVTGDFAAVSGIPNLKNAFTSVYESRYVSGVVAGLKLKELTESGVLTTETQPESFDENGNVKIGYVGAFSYAEVVSGYTAFFLGVRSVMPNVVMEVNYTNSWFDIDKEGAAAEALMANGCAMISQHADSTGAPAAVQKKQDDGMIVYCVGYNVDMIPTAPTAALTSAGNNWEAYYEYAFNCMLTGEEIKTDWSEGFAGNGVLITPLNEEIVAEGTAEYVDNVIASLKDGSLKVFDTDTFTVEGQKVETAEVDFSYMDFSTMTAIYEGETKECIQDGAFLESYYRSAPYFSLRIDGITEK